MPRDRKNRTHRGPHGLGRGPGPAGAGAVGVGRGEAGRDGVEGCRRRVRQLRISVPRVAIGSDYGIGWRLGVVTGNRAARVKRVARPGLGRGRAVW